MSQMELKRLPRELISEILQYNIQYSALDLWKCGDVQLNYLLANGGVTEVVLKNDNEDIQNRWPSILPRFRKLTLLAIYSPNTRLGDIEYVRRSLMQLSPTMRTLYLSFRNAEEAILDPLELELYISRLWVSDGDAANNHRSNPINRAVRNNSKARKLWPLQDKFPNLQNLTIDSFDLRKPQFDLDGLPEGLITLKIHCCRTWKLRDTQVLPRTLEKLDLLNMTIGGSYVLKHLPPGLRSLNGITVWRDNDLKLLEYLPITLTELGQFKPETHRIADFTLPPNLTHLNLLYTREVTPEWAKNYLPSTLTYLLIGEVHYTSELAQSLPCGLKHLELPEFATRLQTAPILPPLLTTLSVLRPIPNLLDFVASLPSTLTCLKMGAIDRTLVPEVLNRLPHSLLELSSTKEILIACESCKTTGRPLLPSFTFPKRLTTLSDVHLAMKSEDQPDMATQFVGLLPRSLTSLNIHLSYPKFGLYEGVSPEDLSRPSCYTWSPQSVSALPPSLHQLFIYEGLQIAGYHYYLLPRSLTSYSTYSHDFMVPVLQHHLAHLPPNLIIYDHVYSALMETREYGAPEDAASLDNKKDASSPFIIEDPIHQRVTVPFRANYQAPSNWASLLPKTLTTFRTRIPLNATDCAQLPRSIRNLSTSIFGVIPEQISTLPTRLATLEAHLSFLPSARPFSPTDLPPLLTSANLLGFDYIWNAYKKWTRSLKSHPPLPYAIAYPSNPSDPPRLHKRLHLD